LTFLPYYVQAARFIRNVQYNSCLQHLSNITSTSSCFSLSSTSCPVDRFGSISTTVTWNLVPVDLSSSSDLTNSTKLSIESSDNQFCLSSGNTSAPGEIQVCPCDKSASQIWKIKGDGLINSESSGKCLSMSGNKFGLDDCNLNSTSMSWKYYHVAPNAVNVYANTFFSGKLSQLHVGTYNSEQLT
ncbi:11692_t:CDS:2, partial [Acaulospora morrowiae]